MKRLLFLLLFGGLVLCGLATLCQSCDNALQRYQNTEQTDSIKFQELLVKCLPSAQRQIYTFDDVTDVMAYKLERQRQHDIDSIFMTLSDQQIANITAVLLKHKQRCSISEIVTEYCSYKRVYDGLPDGTDESTSNKDSPIKVIELEAIKIDAESINVKPDSSCAQ